MAEPRKEKRYWMSTKKDGEMEVAKDDGSDHGQDGDAENGGGHETDSE